MRASTYLIIFIISILYFNIISCGSSVNSKIKKGVKDKYEVVLKIQYREPYCGGMRPNKEMEKGYLKDFSNKDFFIRKGDSNFQNTSFCKKIKTDEKGMVDIKLSRGNYGIFFSEKNIPYEQFKKNQINNIKGKSLELSSDECLENYWKSPDATINVSESGNYSVEIQKICYSEFNYCLKYTGIYPP